MVMRRLLGGCGVGRWGGLLVALALALAGCQGHDGDGSATASETGEGPSTADVEGFWQLRALTLDGGGAPLERDGAPLALRGAVEISAITTIEGALRSRYMVIDGGLPADLPGIVNATFTLADDGRWLVSPVDGGLHVYRQERVDAALILAWEPADPRNGADVPTLPIRFELIRLPEPERKPVGTWNLVKMSLPSGVEVTDESCVLGDDMTYRTFELGLDIDRFYGFSRKTSDDRFFDPACSMDADAFYALSTGIAEDLGDRLLTWLVLEDGYGLAAEYVEYGMSRAGDRLTLTRIACLPRPDCEANLPLSITVVLTGL